MSDSNNERSVSNRLLVRATTRMESTAKLILYMYHAR